MNFGINLKMINQISICGGCGCRMGTGMTLGVDGYFSGHAWSTIVLHGSWGKGTRNILMVNCDPLRPLTSIKMLARPSRNNIKHGNLLL